MTEVIQVLRQEHANLAKLLHVLERQISRFDEGNSPDYDIVEGVLNYCLNYPEFHHHPNEDLIFRRLEMRDAETAKAIGNLSVEHEKLSTLTRSFAEAVQQIMREAELPRDTIHNIAREFLEHYWRHMEMEEKNFFPSALRHLTPKDWAEIDAQILEQDDPLFGHSVEERYQVLRKNILDWDQSNFSGGY